MAKKIPLTQGKFTLVDDGDYEYLMRWKWCFHASGYACRGVTKPKKKIILMHRQLLDVHKSKFVDHKNGNRLDNRRRNIRIVTKLQNTLNRTGNKISSSRYKGVSWDGSRGLWLARICINRKQKNLGRFKKETDAARAYNVSAKILHMEYAKINKISN